jgi:hypothetical protein
MIKLVRIPLLYGTLMGGIRAVCAFLPDSASN